ncbi:endolytic transglycosylase MltG [Sandaracinobacteroides saxicola]|uniref:Endolytic murein transglycosylase n=1 Tax=Sandaracinobacteroides saxicola TaxID=2759707 RepID=A0A7G5IG67_9SPHN|nr:endolytic transglycosylase MltG [Sandaracinobacteroides saxicola]QMW22359.1 endolytic transglycosylase MltG [Sandaracinobacteroides saxicola]
MMRRLSLLAIAGFALIVALGAGLSWLWVRDAPPGAAAVVVTVPKGASVAGAARALEAAGVVASAEGFRVMARLFGGDRAVQFGRYEIPRGLGWGRILEKMQAGDVIRSRIVIPEGWPSIMVAERLRAADDLVGPVEVPAEGSVLPATWDYKAGETRAAVLKRMQDGMVRTLEALWPTRKGHSVVKSKAEAVTLAAIVEKETAIASERRRIAGVYSNRLRVGMKLDADPTVIYPITQGKPLGRRIRLSELRRDTGYNTYVRPGLPKGPIANPGRDSIAAVLDPERHDYLFFVADGKGGHIFARSYDEHRANVAKWYDVRRSRGEM